MELNKLVGKTISRAEILGVKGYDDQPYMRLTFTDETSITLCASFGGYTGDSVNEYPCWISISEPDEDQETFILAES